MAFVAPTPLFRLQTRPVVSPRRLPRHRPTRACASSEDVSRVTPSPTTAPLYGVEEDVCTFGAECELTEDCVNLSPALQKQSPKYVFPMREGQTQVFFDNSVSDTHTLLILFAEDHHGLVLDIVSVFKALKVRVHRTASSHDEALRLLMSRIEGELVSLKNLGINLQNCVAFWLTDEPTGEKIFDDSTRLAQLAECIKIELNNPYPRPRPAFDDRWHRVSVQKNRADRYTALCLQTPDRPRLLAEVTSALAEVDIDVASATINTLAERVENTFFVTKHGFKKPLDDADTERALESVLRALLRVGDVGPNETLWYQTRDGTAMLIAEAIFIDEVNNRELSCFKFSQMETPNFRGRLPEAPYQPISLV